MLDLARSSRSTASSYKLLLADELHSIFAWFVCTIIIAAVRFGYYCANTMNIVSSTSSDEIAIGSLPRYLLLQFN